MARARGPVPGRSSLVSQGAPRGTEALPVAHDEHPVWDADHAGRPGFLEGHAVDGGHRELRQARDVAAPGMALVVATEPC